MPFNNVNNLRLTNKCLTIIKKKLRHEYKPLFSHVLISVIPRTQNKPQIQ